jgi:hypothetical protein
MVETGPQIVVGVTGGDHLGGVRAQLLGDHKVRLDTIEDPGEMPNIRSAIEKVGGNQPKRSAHGRRTLTR